MRPRSSKSIYRHSVVVLSLVSAFMFLSAIDSSAQTWGRTYHGPWTEYFTSSTFYDTLASSDGGYLLTGTSNGKGVILKVVPAFAVNCV